MRKKIISVVVVIAGLILLCYPWISEWTYEHSVDSTVNVYENHVEEIDNEELQQMLEEAREYNKNLEAAKAELTDPFIPNEDETENSQYESILSLDDAGMMCIIDIPKTDVYLPVYHGASTEVLKMGAGHLEGSSFPVGGESTHAVISAHTGMSTAKMFTDLTDMEEGDLFFIHILNETLAYRVCDIQVILPDETDSLTIRTGSDLVSLVTCTPYGQNTHRLVVTGERTEYTEEIEEEAAHQTTDDTSQWMDEYRKAVILGILITVIIFVTVSIVKKVKQRRKYSAWRKGGR